MTIPGHAVTLGTISGTGQRLIMTPQQRSTHLYIPGATGTGKSRLMEHMIREHILHWPRHRCSAIVFDPHGSLFNNVMTWCARHNLDRPIIPIDLRRDDHIIGYNLLRRRGHASSSVVIDELVMALAHVWGATGTDQTPLLARWAAHIFQALYEKGLSVAEASMLLENPTVRGALTSNLSDRLSARDWNLVSTFSRKQLEEQIGSTVNRLPRLVRNPTLYATFGQTESSLDLRTALDDGSIILISLATEGGKVTLQDADTFGTVLLTDLWAAARERGKNKAGQKPCYLFLDEFQRFITPDIAESLAEARGFGLHICAANQFPGQLLDEGEAGKKLYKGIMENARSKAVFQLADQDNLQALASWLFRGLMDPDEIKLALHSTKVMGYRQELRRSHSRGTSRTEGGGKSTSDGTNDSSGEAVKADEGAAHTSSTGTSKSETASSSWADTMSESVTEHIVDTPIIGRELSSVQFRSLDEQLHRAVVALSKQPQRHCVVRLEGMQSPVSIRVPDVPDIRLPARQVEKYRLGLLAKIPFSIPMAEALRRMDERQKNLLANILHDNVDMPAEAIVLRRKID